jgi:hypothetical protein
MTPEEPRRRARDVRRESTMKEFDGRRRSKCVVLVLVGQEWIESEVPPPEMRLVRFILDVRRSAAMKPARDKKARKSSGLSVNSSLSLSGNGIGRGGLLCGCVKEIGLEGGVGAGRGFSKYGLEEEMRLFAWWSMGTKFVFGISFGDEECSDNGDIFPVVSIV